MNEHDLDAFLARLYMEDVEEAGGDIDANVRQLSGTDREA